MNKTGISLFCEAPDLVAEVDVELGAPVVVSGGLPVLVSELAQLVGVRQTSVGFHHGEPAGGIPFRPSCCPLGGGTLIAGCGFGHDIGHAVRADPAEHAGGESRMAAVAVVEVGEQ